MLKLKLLVIELNLSRPSKVRLELVDIIRKEYQNSYFLKKSGLS